MAQAVVTVRIMPENPDVNLELVQEQALKIIKELVGEGGTKIHIQPIAFGLKALDITFVMDEALGSPDSLEDQIVAIDGVNSYEVTDVRRAIG